MFSRSRLHYRYTPPECAGICREDVVRFVLRCPSVEDLEATREIITQGGDGIAQTVYAIACCLVSVEGLEGEGGLPFALPSDMDGRTGFVRRLPAHWFRGLSEAVAARTVVTSEEERPTSESAPS